MRTFSFGNGTSHLAEPATLGFWPRDKWVTDGLGANPVVDVSEACEAAAVAATLLASMPHITVDRVQRVENGVQFPHPCAHPCREVGVEVAQGGRM